MIKAHACPAKGRHKLPADERKEIIVTVKFNIDQYQTIRDLGELQATLRALGITMTYNMRRDTSIPNTISRSGLNVPRLHQQPPALP